MFWSVDMFIVCTCAADIICDLFVCSGQYVSLCDGHIYDCIVFGFWYAVTTLDMFLVYFWDESPL